MKEIRHFTLLASVFFVLLGTACEQLPKGMAHIQGGTFTMGSPETDPDYVNWEGPQHQVTVSSFYMGKYTVTQQEYNAVMGHNPGHVRGASRPVESISWYDALAYCNALSKREWLKPAYSIDGTNVTWDSTARGYRLPTEAEWEYACRAGTSTYYNTGNSITRTRAWFEGSEPVEVGHFPPNAWGLYDMHGNVYEWCWDWYGDYGAGPQTNPQGALSGDLRIIRGGGGGSDAQHVRSAERGRIAPSAKNVNLGFRVVRNAK